MSLNPYDAPRPELIAAEAVAYPHSPAMVRAIAVIFLLNALFELLSSFLLEPFLVSVEERGFEELGDSRETLLMFGVGMMGVACIVLIVYFIGVVLFCIFIHRAHQNARSFGAIGMRYTAGWVVASFFIPVVNLVLPYLAIREIFQASDPDAGPDTWRSRPANIVSLWWSAWIVSLGLIAVNVALAMSEDPMLLQISGWLDLISAGMYVVTALLAIKLVYDIARRQSLVAARKAATPTF